MQRSVLILASVVVLSLTWRLVDSRVSRAQQSPSTEGSRVVEAAGYDSLQAAIDALPAAGGKVVLPPGTFEIQTPLRIRVGDVLLEGAGTATHIRNLNQEGQPALLLAHPQAAAGRRDRSHELWRIRIADLRITGNEKSGPGIEARSVNEIHLDGITVSNHGGHGVLLDYCYEDPRISDCLITYNQAVGVKLVGCHDIVVSGNQFEENHDALHCLDGFNLTMSGNNLDDHLGNGVVIENTYGSVVAANMIEECRGPAIVLDRDCYGITLSANVIAHNGAGIELRDAHGCAVSANTFTLMKSHALRISPASGRIAVSGNSFCDSYIGAGQVRRAENDREAGGLVLDGAAHVAVTGNVFSGLQPGALSVRGESRHVIFSHNVLTAAAAETTKLNDSLSDRNLSD